jgi:paraquat-inducible protein B
MATLGTTVLTYADWAKRMEEDGIAAIIELLSQTNEILLDMLVLEGNLPTGHKTTVRTGLPQATWRLLNYGVPQGKSTTAQIVDTTGNLETYAEVDKDLADLNGNTSEFRMSEVTAFLEGMNQQMATTAIYGNTGVNPERFMGIAPRYNTVTTATAQTAANVIDMGGTGSTNTSLGS